MYLTGFADEAARDLETQIKATKEIGWTQISPHISQELNKAIYCLGAYTGPIGDP